MEVYGLRQAQAALSPRITRHPLYRGLGGPQGRSGRVRKIPSTPGFDPRTVQPVASRYTRKHYSDALTNTVLVILRNYYEVQRIEVPKLFTNLSEVTIAGILVTLLDH